MPTRLEMQAQKHKRKKDFYHILCDIQDFAALMGEPNLSKRDIAALIGVTKQRMYKLYTPKGPCVPSDKELEELRDLRKCCREIAEEYSAKGKIAHLEWTDFVQRQFPKSLGGVSSTQAHRSVKERQDLASASANKDSEGLGFVEKDNESEEKVLLSLPIEPSPKTPVKRFPIGESPNIATAESVQINKLSAVQFNKREDKETSVLGASTWKRNAHRGGGGLLKSLHKTTKFSIYDIAICLGVGIETIALWENGGLKPTKEEQKKIQDLSKYVQKHQKLPAILPTTPLPPPGEKVKVTANISKEDESKSIKNNWVNRLLLSPRLAFLERSIFSSRKRIIWSFILFLWGLTVGLWIPRLLDALDTAL